MDQDRSQHIRVVGIAIIAALLALSGCDDDNPLFPPQPPGTSEITGTFTGRNDGGALTMTIATKRIGRGDPHIITTSEPVSALMGTVGIAGFMTSETGDTTSLTGTYFEAADSLSLSGGGYTFSGILVVYLRVLWLTGRYVGPNGVGAFIGLVGSTDTVKTYCGTFRSDSTTMTGRWNFAVRGDTLVGFALDQGSEFELGFFSLLTGTTGERQFQGIAGKAPSSTFYWLGSVNASAGLASGTWLGFVGGILHESGTWTAASCSPGGTRSP